ncbi:PRD domain-containing protein [Staphylococcus condimenti]|uniref:PRD domain-containing protein n=1 Tax=Staphylococcus condimenti TaxID=70255 RepID=A0AB37HBE0_9STAP|nr:MULTISPECIES: PRD domain-containing protein [Staphylococcus]AMY05978.1 hypothetical protein A4G25_08570 [Staphylococcus condimenti]APR59840.1 hypothetical protein BTZ13_00850 [Staphylococcus condimenti]MDK8644969.1 PRD domain-containing protein [Staphylococcus condimenti]OFP02988.1 hypothetical protein HMPREF3007_08190 [Staphylococcus sp. HMSC065E08]PNZ57223.1 PRD domain-containing protein [Staphylococcus condimenti]
MPLNQKHFKLVQILLKSNLPIDKAAIELDISEKTIINYIKQINREFTDIFSIRKRDSLLVLTIMDDQKFWDELNKDSILNNGSESILTNRLGKLFYELIINDISLIDDLSEKLYLSRTALNTLVTELREKIKEYNLQIIGKPNVGISLKGKEIYIRKFTIEKLPKILNEEELPQPLNEKLDKLKNTMNLDTQTFFNLQNSIKITLLRLSKHKFIEKDSFKNTDAAIFKSNEFNTLNFLNEYISQTYASSNSNYELLLIAIQLLGRRASLMEEIINESDEKLIMKIINNTIRDVKRYFDIQIDEDLFNKDIKLHIKHLINRLIFNIKLENNVSAEMDIQFPFAFELSKILGDNITKYTGLSISKPELGFLTIYFSVYLEQLEQRFSDMKNIGIYTDGGLSTIKLLSSYLYKIFGKDISIEAIEKTDLSIVESEYDFIISTQPLNRLFNKIIYIENVFNEKHFKLRIEQFLIYKDISNKEVFNRSVILDFINERDFYHLSDADDYYSVIHFLASEMIDEQRVDSKFDQTIIEREKLKSTINKAVGFPHATHSMEGIQIKVAILDNTIKSYPDLKIVILIATPKTISNEAILIRIYEEVLSITKNTYLTKKITSQTDFEDFVYLLNEEMRD